MLSGEERMRRIKRVGGLENERIKENWRRRERRKVGGLEMGRGRIERTQPSKDGGRLEDWR